MESCKETILLSSVGDIMLCDSPLNTGRGLGSIIRKKGMTDYLKECKKVFHCSDIVIGNLEGPIYSPSNSSINEVQMATDFDSVRYLRECNFAVLNVANNHCMQHGSVAFNETIHCCQKNGIAPIGRKGQECERIKIKGMIISFISLSLRPEQYVEQTDILYENNLDEVLKKVRIEKEKFDSLVVLSIHWGEEYLDFPSSKQIQLSHSFIDNGVDVVLGHHSHVFQGIEQYKAGIIVYGQGNFISDMIQKKSRQTAIVHIKIDKDKTINYSVKQFEIRDDYVLMKSEIDWFSERQKLLTKADAITEDVYQELVLKSQSEYRNIYKQWFKKNFYKFPVRYLFGHVVGAMNRRIRKWA